MKLRHRFVLDLCNVSAYGMADEKGRTMIRKELEKLAYPKKLSQQEIDDNWAKAREKRKEWLGQN